MNKFIKAGLALGLVAVSANAVNAETGTGTSAATMLVPISITPGTGLSFGDILTDGTAWYDCPSCGNRFCYPLIRPDCYRNNHCWCFYNNW